MSTRRSVAWAGSTATVVEVVDDVDVLVLVVLVLVVLVLVVLLLLVVVGAVVLVVGATTSTRVGPRRLSRVRLKPATATTRAATTMQRLRRIDACFIYRLTLQRPEKLPSLRCSSVTAWEGFRALLRFADVVGHYDHRRV